MMASRKILTADSGAPVTDNQNSRTAGPAGPVLIEDHHLIEKLAHFDRFMKAAAEEFQS
jgi:catalase